MEIIVMEQISVVCQDMVEDSEGKNLGADFRHLRTTWIVMLEELDREDHRVA